MASRLVVPASAQESLWDAVRTAQRVRRQSPVYTAQWRDIARPEQLPPDGVDWRTWYLRGGRGSGKTRGGAEWLAEQLRETAVPGEWAIVAPTFADARDKCVEGPSGLIHALRRQGPGVVKYNRSASNAQIQTTNGHTVYLDGAKDGALRIQGYNLSGAWADEIGLWSNWNMAWTESLAFAVRIAPAQIVATGTPKVGHKLVGSLLKDARTPDATGVVTTLALTEDNIENLAPSAVAELKRRYAGTHLERQELLGEYIDTLPGALWTRGMIDDNRREMPDDFERIVVAIDPAVSNTEGSDETGIIVAGTALCDCQKDTRGIETHAFILEDRSLIGSPYKWAAVAIKAYKQWEADRIIAERNNGGDMVETTIRGVDFDVPIKTIWASRGKRVRAEPVQARYEQGMVHHCGPFPELEDQMTLFGSGVEEHDDRVDVVVYAVSELLGGDNTTFEFGWA